jgi:hypothetical protein
VGVRVSAHSAVTSIRSYLLLVTFVEDAKKDRVELIDSTAINIKEVGIKE